MSSNGSTGFSRGTPCRVNREGEVLHGVVGQIVRPMKDGEDPVIIVDIAGSGEQFAAFPQDLRRGE